MIYTLREQTRGQFYMNEMLKHYCSSNGGLSIAMYAAYYNHDRKTFDKLYQEYVENPDRLNSMSVQQIEKLRVINKKEGKIKDSVLIEKMFDFEPDIFIFLLFNNRKLFQKYLYKPWFYKAIIRYFVKKENFVETLDIFKRKLFLIKTLLSGRI